ncbi:hypothetical protein [Brevundimonas goettingensis]|uniref:Uncharacterized protein n=1 Tax=Brevundimonas goettingensis TaxID=2774190 RepID=A0A975C066_9CAUL|nr:hypothetical protein [Brevundimonas goettingensis]QTC91273.1 hypothetical protein IFJ75_19090 [Brevundimonas goettingensis]
MTDDLDTRSTDIAWIRSLAEEGANAPLGGGRILMAAGVIYGLASLTQWAAITGLTPFSVRQSNWIWLAATAVFLLLTLLDKLLLCPAGGVRTAANRAAQAAWACVGTGIFAMIASIAVVAWKIGPTGGALIFLLPSLIMVFYGLGWGVSAAMMRSTRLGALSVASFVSAVIIATMTGSDTQYLAYAVALFALMALPGFLLMRAAGPTRFKGA